MKNFVEKHTSDDVAPYVTKIMVDTEEKCISFCENSSDNYDALCGIFATYPSHNHDGMKPTEYTMEKNSASNIVSVTGDLNELVELFDSMGLISKSIKSEIMKFINESQSYISASSCKLE